jgi:pimeloyl-ACP methyl ester carboxylesterase
MAAETMAFLEAVVPTPASLVGWSDGAVVGALVAMSRPDLVARLALIGQFFDLSGAANPGFGAALQAMRDDPPSALRGNYDSLSPDGPEHFPVVFAKTVDMLVAEPTIPMAELAAITAPTLVLQGDRDEVRLSHSVEVVATLPDARLAVLPGTHALPLESPGLVNALLLDFLAHGSHDLDWTEVLELGD